jgi:hypothetical protein
MCQALGKKYVEYVVACYLGQGPCYSKEEFEECVHALQQTFFKCDMVEGNTIASYICKIEMVIS